MDTRGGTQRYLRDTRVIQNLPLRRRCLFLCHRGFLAACFHAHDAAAPHRAASVKSLLRTLLRVCEHDGTGEGEIAHAAQQMLDFVTSRSRATTRGEGNAMECVGYADWEEGVETLLLYLEEPHEVSAGHSPVSRTGETVPTSTALAADGGAPSPTEVSVETAVRQLLCGLVKELYDCGAAYYAVEKEQKARAVAATSASSITADATTTADSDVVSRKRARETDSEDLTSLAEKTKSASAEGAMQVPMRVTWSVAAPLSQSVVEVFRNR